MHERSGKSITAIRAEQPDDDTGFIIGDGSRDRPIELFDPLELGDFSFILGWQWAKLFKRLNLRSHSGLGHLICGIVKLGSATDVLNNRVVSKLKREDSAPGLRSFGADKNANCNPRTDTKSKIADRDTDCAANRHAKTNPAAHVFGISFAG